MSNKFEQYKHHGTTTWVRKSLRGTHRDVCLCYDCKQFNPDPVFNCPIAQKLFEFCVEHNTVTPVYECAVFKEGERYKFTTETGK